MSSTAVYLRVSTSGQTTDQQRDAITSAGITPDRVFTDNRFRQGWFPPTRLIGVPWLAA